MQAMDRLGWVVGTGFDAYGVRFGVRSNEPAVMEKLPDYLPPGWKPIATPIVDHLYSFRAGGRPRRGVREYDVVYSGLLGIARTLDRSVAYERLAADLRQQVAARARRAVFVHAGVVAWRGRAIVIPGRSGSGKTTLVAELIKAGAEYYSDEFAVIDVTGRVHPFAKPLSIRERGGNGARMEAVEALGGVPGTRPLPVGLVAFTEYRPRARWRPARMTRGRGLLALLAHTAPVRERPAASMAALERALESATIVKSPRDEAERLAPLLLESLR
jgi:hypothetical protein